MKCSWCELEQLICEKNIDCQLTVIQGGIGNCCTRYTDCPQDRTQDPFERKSTQRRRHEILSDAQTFEFRAYKRRDLRLFNEDLHPFCRTPLQMNESNSRWKLGIAPVRTLLIGFEIHASSRWQVEWATERTDERSKCNNFLVLITHLTIDFISFNYAFFFLIFPFHSCGMCEYVKRQHRERCAPFYRQPRNGFWHYFHFEVHMREAANCWFSLRLCQCFMQRECVAIATLVIYPWHFEM